MYHIYHTEGFVLGGTETGEANRYLNLFTKDLGLVSASAQSLRDLKSKLRYSLQDFSHSSFDLVRGKTGWRVTSAQSIVGYASLLSAIETERFQTFARMCKLMRRLLQGEEKNERLYESFKEAAHLLKEKKMTPDAVANVEIMTVMRILHHLGYWGNNQTLSPYLNTSIKECLHAHELASIRSLAVREINKSLQETQL